MSRLYPSRRRTEKSSRSPDWYQALGVESTASQDDIEARFKELSLLHYQQDQFRDIRSAYEVLRHPEQRRLYDEERAGARPTFAVDEARQPSWPAAEVDQAPRPSRPAECDDEPEDLRSFISVLADNFMINSQTERAKGNTLLAAQLAEKAQTLIQIGHSDDQTQKYIQDNYEAVQPYLDMQVHGYSFPGGHFPAWSDVASKPVPQFDLEALRENLVPELLRRQLEHDRRLSEQAAPVPSAPSRIEKAPPALRRAPAPAPEELLRRQLADDRRQSGRAAARPAADVDQAPQTSRPADEHRVAQELPPAARPATRHVSFSEFHESHEPGLLDEALRGCMASLRSTIPDVALDELQSMCPEAFYYSDVRLVAALAETRRRASTAVSPQPVIERFRRLLPDRLRPPDGGGPAPRAPFTAVADEQAAAVTLGLNVLARHVTHAEFVAEHPDNALVYDWVLGRLPDHATVAVYDASVPPAGIVRQALVAWRLGFHSLVGRLLLQRREELVSDRNIPAVLFARVLYAQLLLYITREKGGEIRLSSLLGEFGLEVPDLIKTFGDTGLRPSSVISSSPWRVAGTRRHLGRKPGSIDVSGDLLVDGTNLLAQLDSLERQATGRP